MKRLGVFKGLPTYLWWSQNSNSGTLKPKFCSEPAVLSSCLSPRITPLSSQEICSCLWNPPICHSYRGSSIPSEEFSDCSVYVRTSEGPGWFHQKPDKNCSPQKSFIAVLFVNGQSKLFPHCQHQKLPHTFFSMVSGSSHSSCSLASGPTYPRNPPPASSPFPPWLTLLSHIVLLHMYFFFLESPSFFLIGCKPLLSFPDGSVGKESICIAGDASSIPESGRCTGGGNGNPLQCSCLENPWTEEPGGLQPKVGGGWKCLKGLCD